MIEINQSWFKYPPLSYQAQGLRDLLTHPKYALFWEMRLRKSKVVLDAAGCLYQAGELEVLVIACPSQVKDVWLDTKLGEIQKHSFVPVTVYDYDSKISPEAVRARVGKGKLLIIVTSLEFLRQEDERSKYPKMIDLAVSIQDLSNWLVIDEGAALANPVSATSRSIFQLRKVCQRVTILDGTPDDGTPQPLYSKFKTLDPAILGFKDLKHFNYTHAIYKRQKFGGRQTLKIVGWQKLDELAKKTAPYCSVLKQTDVKGILDLPAFEPGILTARLSEETWRIYKDMRDEMIVQLRDGDISWTRHASTKVLRLAQIASGFLGGVEGEEEAKELSHESALAFCQWVNDRLAADPQFKCVVWCRWRPEIERLAKKLGMLFTQYGLKVGQQWGDVKDDNFLHPDHPYCGAGIMVCQPQAVKYGVSFAKAPAQVFLSRDYNIVTQSQAEQRVQDDVKKIGRTTTLLLDMVISGPQGQKTVVHDIVRCLREKINVGKRLTMEWRKVLLEE